ncbi:thermonuclease family protein [Candidatus Wolfebacteria bacterium]|nr:thermonuclease family protein [Candidatus Wolfebacteria bacterium]MBL1434560.1 thermonuclease family protein [Candidatus Wolfebacteria bacterium]
MKINPKVLSAILSVLIAGGAVGGYRIIQDRGVDVFENSIHAVTHVVDGDTFDIEGGARIRLLGVDTPERGECFYNESKDFLDDLIEDSHVRFEKDISGADRYGRLLRYVYVPSDSPEEADVFVQEVLVRGGYALNTSVAPDNRYRDLFSSAKEDARLNERGMWGACDITVDRSLRETDSKPVDDSCAIKGNISEKGYGKLYFFEGCPNYNRIKIDIRKGEAYFCTEKEAESAGFTKSESCNNAF